MQVLRGENVAFGRVRFRDGEGVQQPVDVLHVRDVTADADDRFRVERLQAFDVRKAGQGSVRCWQNISLSDLIWFDGAGWSMIKRSVGTHLDCLRL